MRTDRSGRWWFLVVGLGMLLLASVAGGWVPSPADDARSTDTDAAAEVSEAVKPSVVTVYTYSPTFSPGATGLAPTGAGSGWAYSDDGYVITNAHVVLGVESVKVMTFAGDLIPATVVGTDWYQDVAVLRLEPDNGQALPPAATIGDSSRLDAGDQVFAIGTPHGQFANTVEAGAVGGTGRSIDTGSGYTLMNLILHNATLWPGNSGGPLVSVDGDVIGMNVASTQSSPGDQPINERAFAIDGNTVLAVADEIIANGTVNHPYLGVTSQVAPGGQLVAEVEPDSPAAVAGIQPGDIITAIDDRAVNVDGWFIDLLYQYSPDDVVTLTIDRNGESLSTDVVLTARPAASE